MISSKSYEVANEILTIITQTWDDEELKKRIALRIDEAFMEGFLAKQDIKVENNFYENK